jgi:rod shape-determining protein MreC
MQNLIQFFIRFAAFFLFVLLEVVCFMLIIRHNEAQREIFLNSSTLIAAKTNEWYDGIVEYSKLQDLADSLANENAKLKSELYNNRSYLELQKDVRFDTLYHQRYQTIRAQVINNSVTSRNNSMTIDRGSDDGIEKGMGVIGAKGVVGVVRNIRPSFSNILSILHSASRVSVSLRRNQYFGTLVWKGFNPQKMSLEAVPKHADIQIGDTVETSGYSHIFPKGLMVGTVDTFWIEGGSNFYTIDVSMVNDLSKVNQVYVVKNLVKMELDSLEKAMLNE